MKLQEQIRQEFQQYKDQAHASDDAWAHLRGQAFEEFEKLGFPTTRHEEWKYTSLKQVADKQFVNVSSFSTNAEKLLQNALVTGIRANRLVFINGVFQETLSQVIETDASLILSNITSARRSHTKLFEEHFGRYAKIEGLAMNALNTALVTDGAFIHVPAGKSVEHPVLIVNIADASEANVLSQPRNLVIVGKSASVKLVEAYYSTGTNASFTNVVTEIYADEHAHVEHYKVQDQVGESYHNNFTQVFQEANTSVNHVTVTLDGTLVRNNLHFFMNGEGCDTLLYGLYITDKNNHVDNHTRVDHAMPNCTSNELYKGVMKDKSTAVFNGKIIVHPDAQKTNAYQRNQNILLSEEATVNTKPQLEIFADDVKCTHGATVGQLDEEPMFYLRSRGIPEAEARRMLLNAFADDIAERILIGDLVQILEEEISKKL